MGLFNMVGMKVVMLPMELELWVPLRTWYMSSDWMRLVLLVMAPMELLLSLLKAAFDGARMVTLVALDSIESNCGFADTTAVRLDRSGLPPNAAVRFIDCAEAVAARAARDRVLNCIVERLMDLIATP